MAPNNNRGTTYQTNVKHFSNLREYFVGVVKLAFHCYNNCFLLCVFTNNHLKYLSNRTLRKLVKRYVYEFFGPPRLAPYLLISHPKRIETDQCCLPQHGPLDIHQDQRQEVPAQPLRAPMAMSLGGSFLAKSCTSPVTMTSRATPSRVCLLMHKGHKCYCKCRTGKHKHKPISGCIVDQDIAVFNLPVVKTSDATITGLTTNSFS